LIERNSPFSERVIEHLQIFRVVFHAALLGAAFDEKSVPLGQEGLQGSFERGRQTHPGAARPLSLSATPPLEGIFKGDS